MKRAKLVVEGFPGISANLAKVLLGYFASISRLANSSLADLSAASGIGPLRAKSVYETLHVGE